MDSDTASLASQAMELLLTNQFTNKYNVSSFKNVNNKYWTRYNRNRTPDTKEFIRPTICSCSSNVRGVQESTSTLLSARALVKANRTEECWAYLESLFSVQASNGFLPKYRYFPNDGNDGQNDHDSDNSASSYYYYNSTIIPTSKIFNSSMPKRYLPCSQNQNLYASTCFDSNQEYTFVHELNITSSGRLSALPIHATSILEIFYLSNQTSNDLHHLEFYFDRVYKMHSYWMGNVMKHCDLNDNDGHGACYNIIHPWESMVGMNSPQWNDILKYVDEIIEEEDWVPQPGMIPDHIPVNEPGYKAMIYLLECHANVTHGNETEKQTSVRGPSQGDYETKLIKQCPFAMMDLSHLSVLTRSNHDLYQIGKILHDSHSKKAPTKTLLHTMENWIDLTTKLNAQLWNEEAGRYASRNMLFNKNHSSDILGFDFVGSEFVDSHNAADLMTGWNTETNSSRFMSTVVSPLLDRDADFSFNCGSYPIWSWACSRNDKIAIHSAATPSIYPLINYWVSIGLKRNGAEGLGNYVQQSTLQLMCADSNDFGGLLTGACSNLTFGNTYNAQKGIPLTDSSYCDLTSTTSGAILYNLLQVDKPFSFKPSPPIQNGWVIVLVVAEIMIAFSIGLSCLLLSLNLMRRLKKDADEYEIIQLAQEQNREQDDNEQEVDRDESEDDTFSTLFWKLLDN